MKVVILGSTGSIGTQALDVISHHSDLFEVTALAAGGSHVRLLAKQAHEFGVRAVALADSRSVSAFRDAFESLTSSALPQLFVGKDAASAVAALAPDGVVLNGITGSVGLRPTLAALKSGATLALANKESLVVGGGLIADACTRPGQIVPVDSEHSAIYQALRSGRHHRGLTSVNQDGVSEVSRLILTASGGPFRTFTREQMANVSAQDALHHPTWSMGPVVTINSSTLMNKGLELIEASYLFDIAPQRIVPVVHPQSIVHSMVEFVDGSSIAQASPPDMRLPIALGLSAPVRLDNVAAPNAWDSPTSWDFEPLNNELFPAVSMAREAVATSPLHPAVMNAANEEAVEAFLDGRIGYLDIVATVAQVLDRFEHPGEVTFESVLGVEEWARACAHEVMA
ncbi:1-deoxy-D-xylulose-5-phosphate reductoisomerase [Arcanobacterium wilhelmae]|uniref:1-deoxy-D-xylulose 5-phosphate reductoisomerase n=1 Tax=Arcanobacterium wilhelmae TaxID=1803177 RepID=A0ABT9N9D3_9ACTO|nr:1-deoxy-D-xylulose-5-phosphate reductoisomerase [Arcanobacterium wilhelmae]MDP9800308.1 1-deoxy-D-xylulose-5-phosphate reductoisomerase [Arcanobacterium wilhelmae]WFN89745.1 1-deoxy-D-xylulose-5-phosphate reductoisomerase [Arcanobacterium wilhelmae]